MSGLSREAWWARLRASAVRVRWYTDRDLLFRRLQHRAIQIGLFGMPLRTYANDLPLRVVDVTELCREIKALVDAGDHTRAEELLPHESPLDVPATVASAIGQTACI